MLERITSAMRVAADRGIAAAFFGVDSTRADLDFFRRVYEGAVEDGAREVVVVDTLGVAAPEAVHDLVGRTIQWLGGIPVHFHGHDDFGLATANAVAAVRAGATWIQGTINGMGERAGNADLGETALALRALYGVESNLRLDRIREVSARVRELSGYALEPWKPLTGETLFRRESGAVASQFHDPPSIEPDSSELVGAERGIVRARRRAAGAERAAVTALGIAAGVFALHTVVDMDWGYVATCGPLLLLVGMLLGLSGVALLAGLHPAGGPWSVAGTLVYSLRCRGRRSSRSGTSSSPETSRTRTGAGWRGGSPVSASR